jgi:hypothetical protein
MAIETDFEIQNDKDIRYIGAAHGAAGAGYYTVLEAHEWLRDLADDASSAGDDYMDIARPTPSNKVYDTILEMLNGYNLDDTAIEHLYGGSIIQDSGNIIYDGIQVVAAEGCHVEIVQNGSIISNDFWNSTPDGESTEGLNRDVANGIASRFLIKVRDSGSDIDGRRLLCQTREWGMTYSEFRLNGTGRGINVVPLTYNTDLNNQTVIGTIASLVGISNTEGYANLDVDNDSTDEYYYSEWDRGSNPINDFYEYMKWASRRGTSETLYGLNGELFRGITHDIDIGSGSGTWVEPESCSWTGGTGQVLAVDNTSGGSTSKLYIQLLTGVGPTNTQTITGNGGATGVVSGTPAERSISTPFCGQSTGSALIGAYGFCLEVLDLGTNDKVTALDTYVYSPPDYQQFTLGGLIDGEDYALVGPRGYRFFYDNEASGPFTIGELLTFTSPSCTAYLADLLDLGDYGEMYIGPLQSGSSPPQNNSTIAGSSATADVNGTVYDDINVRQFTLDGALTGGTVTSVVVTEAIPSDTPSSGTIRIKRVSGKYSRHPYSAFNAGTKTFTITSHDFSGDNADDDTNVFISYIDDLVSGADYLDYTAINIGSRSLFVRVRDGGATPIKPFETTATFPGSATAVRTSDA